jgi:hypothetical protein
MINDELAPPFEQHAEWNFALNAVEDVVLVEFNPGKFPPFNTYLVL